MMNLFFSTPRTPAWPTVWRRYSKPPNDCEAVAISCSSSWAPAPSARRSANSSRGLATLQRTASGKQAPGENSGISSSRRCLHGSVAEQRSIQKAIPSKMFEAMAAGKPVILGVEGEAKEILLANQAGLAVRPEDPEAMMAAILKLPERSAALPGPGPERKAVGDGTAAPDRGR